jgi:general secretion pathway protein F
MAEFRYIAVDRAGKSRSGTIAAANDDHARSVLGQRKLHVVKLALEVPNSANGSTHASQPQKPKFLNRPARLNAKQTSVFTRQLATLVSVSPLEEALATIARQTEKVAARGVIEQVHSGIRDGNTLAESMAKAPRSFSLLYRALVAAGEGSGTLSISLERLATLQERQAAVRGKLVAALAYPIILAIIATLVVAALMIFVVPKVVEQFDDVGQKLPFLTRAVMAISGFMAQYWWAIGIGIVLLVIGCTRALMVPSIRLRADKAALRLPLLGALIRDLQAARIARTLSTMVESRMPLLESLHLVLPTIGNHHIRAGMVNIANLVRDGTSLSSALRNSALFPPLMVSMVASGESSGQLAPMLGRSADFLEREFDDVTNTSMALLEPLIIIVMGGVVALIVLSILLPILQLQNLSG